MAETPEEIVEESFSIGARIADVVMGEPESTAESVVNRIVDRIDRADPELKVAQVRRKADRELGELLTPFVDRFLKLLRRTDFRLTLPVLRMEGDDVTIAIDAGNQRATDSIAAIVRAADFDKGFEFDPGASARGWHRVTEVARFIELRPRQETAANFFGRFTQRFWSARRSINSSGSPATVNFTVDCTSNGYQLEYWPQFLFSPSVFGSKLTRPVSAIIPVNHYHFQGWIGGTLTPDSGLYVADPNNTAAMLRAF